MALMTAAAVGAYGEDGTVPRSTSAPALDRSRAGSVADPLPLQEIEDAARAVAGRGAADYGWEELAAVFGERASLVAMVRAEAFDAALARAGWRVAPVLLTRPRRRGRWSGAIARLRSGSGAAKTKTWTECGLRVTAIDEERTASADPAAMSNPVLEPQRTTASSAPCRGHDIGRT